MVGQKQSRPDHRAALLGSVKRYFVLRLHFFLRRILRFNTSGFPQALAVCYVAYWHLPRPDLHRLADDSFAGHTNPLLDAPWQPLATDKPTCSLKLPLASLSPRVTFRCFSARSGQTAACRASSRYGTERDLVTLVFCPDTIERNETPSTVILILRPDIEIGKANAEADISRDYGDLSFHTVWGHSGEIRIASHITQPVLHEFGETRPAPQLAWLAKSAEFVTPFC